MYALTPYRDCAIINKKYIYRIVSKLNKHTHTHTHLGKFILTLYCQEYSCQRIDTTQYVSIDMK